LRRRISVGRKKRHALIPAFVPRRRRSIGSLGFIARFGGAAASDYVLHTRDWSPGWVHTV
jgi:hypothetical protein